MLLHPLCDLCRDCVIPSSWPLRPDIYTKQFDEFIKYIERTGQKDGFRGTTSVGNNLAPDVVDTVRELNTAGYTNQLEPRKMLPDDFNIG